MKSKHGKKEKFAFVYCEANTKSRKNDIRRLLNKRMEIDAGDSFMILLIIMSCLFDCFRGGYLTFV